MAETFRARRATIVPIRKRRMQRNSDFQVGRPGSSSLTRDRTEPSIWRPYEQQNSTGAVSLGLRGEDGRSITLSPVLG